MLTQTPLVSGPPGPLDLVYDAKKDMNIHVAAWAALARPDIVLPLIEMKL